MEAVRSEELFGVWKTRSRPSRPKPLANKTKAIVDPVFAFVTHARKRLFLLSIKIPGLVRAGTTFGPRPDRDLIKNHIKINQVFIHLESILKLLF